MIGFVISTHGSFGDINPNSQRGNGLTLLFSCGNRIPVDVLCKEKLSKNIIFYVLFKSFSRYIVNKK